MSLIGVNAFSSLQCLDAVG